MGESGRGVVKEMERRHLWVGKPWVIKSKLDGLKTRHRICRENEKQGRWFRFHHSSLRVNVEAPGKICVVWDGDSETVLVKTSCVRKAGRLGALTPSPWPRPEVVRRTHPVRVTSEAELRFDVCALPSPSHLPTLGMKKLIWKQASWSPGGTRSLWRMSTPFTWSWRIKMASRAHAGTSRRGRTLPTTSEPRCYSPAARWWKPLAGGGRNWSLLPPRTCGTGPWSALRVTPTWSSWASPTASWSG